MEGRGRGAFTAVTPSAAYTFAWGNREHLRDDDLADRFGFNGIGVQVKRVIKITTEQRVMCVLQFSLLSRVLSFLSLMSPGRASLCS
jgi:hypothetical protein